MSTLKVYPNPWSARDKAGLPCGVCPRDPESDGGGPGQYVGARVDRRRTEVLQVLAKGDDLRSPMQRTVYEYMGIASDDPELAAKLFACAPIELPRTKYYRDRIADRSLLCADKATAESARFKAFVPVAEIGKRYSPKPAPAIASPAAEAEKPIPTPAKVKRPKPEAEEVTS